MASETDRSRIVDIIKGGATPSAFKPVSSNVFIEKIQGHVT